MAIVSSIRGVSRSKVYLFLDIALALAFVAELEEHLVGLRNHELIGVGLGVALHWKWIASHAKKYLFGFIRLPRRQPKPVAVIVRSHRPVSYPEV